MDPLLLSFAGRVFSKLSVALVFAEILALATNSTYPRTRASLFFRDLLTNVIMALRGRIGPTPST
jgi:hypothetical protein